MPAPRFARRALFLLPLVLAGCQQATPAGSGAASRVVARVLPEMGHRNWIVIADSAYPWQSRSGVATVATGEDQLTALKEVLAELERSRHVKPNVLLDAELPHVPESDAPGVTAYRDQLTQLLAGRHVESVPHEEIIKRLDTAGETFRVLVLKTNMTVPYTSVFLQLDCAYWNAESEARLREAMKAGK